MKKEELRATQIRRIFWDAKEVPYANKAAYLLGDLSLYGVSRCKKLIFESISRVCYEFDIYREGSNRVTIVVELPVDFAVKDLERTIMDVWKTGGAVCSNSDIMWKWQKEIEPHYRYDHATYSAMRFLEALRKKLLVNTKQRNSAKKK